MTITITRTPHWSLYVVLAAAVIALFLGAPTVFCWILTALEMI